MSLPFLPEHVMRAYTPEVQIHIGQVLSKMVPGTKTGNHLSVNPNPAAIRYNY